MADHGGKLVRLVANPSIMRDCYPAARADYLQPFFIPVIRREVISVTLDGQSGSCEDGGKSSTQIAIGEENASQAARSYTIACSISAMVRP